MKRETIFFNRHYLVVQGKCKLQSQIQCNSINLVSFDKEPSALIRVMVNMVNGVPALAVTWSHQFNIVQQQNH